MRILAVSHEYPPLGGGGANAAYNLLRGFADRGCEVTLITTGYDRVKEDKDDLTIIEVSSKRSRIESCSFGEMLDFLLKAGKIADRCVKDSINENRPFDIVFIFFGIPSGPIGYHLKKKYKIPYLIRFGGGDVPGFQKRFIKIYKILSPAIKIIWKNADARIANSEGLKEMALVFCNKYDFGVITNGVDIERYKSNPSDKEVTDEETLNILFVSRLIERKGLQHIIPKLNRIAEKTQKSIRLVVVGDGPYKGELEKIARDCGVETMVDFVGEKRGYELLSFYQKGDIFILPSSNEGMPNVVLEAMACGLPVVMTPCQGSGELIADNGFTCSADSFDTPIIELLSDERLRDKMGRKSRERVVNSFSWDAIIDKYIEEIKTII